jgi:hypothetical protein
MKADGKSEDVQELPLALRNGDVGGATGPRTLQGKKRTRHKALKHGVLAKVAVLPGESHAEFGALLRGLRDDLRPVGTLEEALVETIAVTRWRQRRLLIAEGAEIQAGQRFIAWDLKQRQLAEAASFPSVQANGGLIAKISNPEALQRCLRQLEVLKINVESNGFGSQTAISILTRLYGVFDNTHWRRSLFAAYKIWSRGASDPESVRKKARNPSPEECRLIFLKEIDREITRLLEYEHERLSIESNWLELERLRRSVPDSPRLDQLLRYSTALERTFDRTLSQLERVQRMRVGQPVAPRIDVNVSSSQD